VFFSNHMVWFMRVVSIFFMEKAIFAPSVSAFLYLAP